jgi:hypothetical protein
MIDNETSRNQVKPILKDFLLKMFEFATIFKHPKFEAEREWRLISLFSVDSPDGIEFREGISTIIPYITRNLTKENEDFSIRRLIVGPTQDKALSKEAVKTFLTVNKVEFRDGDIVSSEIPYRNL